mmetsp:Transcript_29903/g.62483  ORF Transcript_29903/g.62483 Transcript_29903/m.62483 type:complete len:114 (-) Transcript_29903:497-838(-)
MAEIKDGFMWAPVMVPLRLQVPQLHTLLDVSITSVKMMQVGKNNVLLLMWIPGTVGPTMSKTMWFAWALQDSGAVSGHSSFGVGSLSIHPHWQVMAFGMKLGVSMSNAPEYLL